MGIQEDVPIHGHHGVRISNIKMCEPHFPWTTMLRQETRRSGVSFKEAVNHFLRLGLMSSKGQQRKRFVVEPRLLGLPPHLSYDDVQALLDRIEGGAAK